MMTEKNNPATGNAGKEGNNPYKNDPTKKDERDNDATRIRPEKDNQEKPEETKFDEEHLANDG